MATTTNYGWTTPDDTALVKDGAAAIRSLGSAIDTSMNTALGTKKAGLVLLNTTTFTGVSSQLITVFNSTYANYKIIMDISASTTMTLNARYSANGTPFTTANYSYAVFGLTSGAASVNIAATSQSSFSIATLGWDTEEFEMTIYKPNLATRTAATWQKTGLNSSSAPVYFTGGAVLDNGTQFDQIQLLPSTGTITGTVRTYGFNQ